MSTLSGKCDFYDWFCGLSHKPSPDNPNVLISNDFDSFNEFMKRTNGVIYQSITIPLTRYNIEHELTVNKFLTKNDDGTYTYHGKVYKTYKRIKNYYTTKEIHISDIVDLIQYFPYLIGIMYSSEDGAYIEISSNSYVDKSYYDAREFGYDDLLTDHYKDALSKKYIEIIKEKLKHEV